MSPDVLSLRTFCPAGRFVFTDVLSLRTFCLYGRFVPTDVLSHGCYVSGHFVSGCFVPTDVLSPDVLSGHRPYTVLARCKKNECHQSTNGCVKNDTKGTYLIFLLCRLQINHMKDANCAFMLELGAVANSPIGYFYLKYLTIKLQLNM